MHIEFGVCSAQIQTSHHSHDKKQRHRSSDGVPGWLGLPTWLARILVNNNCFSPPPPYFSLNFADLPYFALLSINFGKINNNNDWFFSLAQFRHSTLVNLGHILGWNFIRSTKPTFGGIGTENLKGCQAKISPDCGKARIKGIKAKPGLLRGNPSQSGSINSILPYSTDSYFHPLVFVFVSLQPVWQGNPSQSGSMREENEFWGRQQRMPDTGCFW